MMKRPRGIQAALTGFYQKRLGRTLALKTTYTVDKYSLTNIGLGLNLQAGPVNFILWATIFWPIEMWRIAIMLLYSSDLILYLGTIIDYLFHMKSRLLLLLVFAVGVGSALNAQLDNYKYIIVPKQFSAFNKENRHQTSTTVKYLFTQKGFTAVYDDSLPEDLANNRCLGLLVELDDSSNMFSTKTTLVLKDCQGDEVYRTIEGRSKIKEYRAAYREALGEAFAPIQAMLYSYTPKEEPKEKKKDAPITVSFKNDIKSVEEKPAQANT